MGAFPALLGAGLWDGADSLGTMGERGRGHVGKEHGECFVPFPHSPPSQRLRWQGLWVCHEPVTTAAAQGRRRGGGGEETDQETERPTDRQTGTQTQRQRRDRREREGDRDRHRDGDRNRELKTRNPSAWLYPEVRNEECVQGWGYISRGVIQCSFLVLAPHFLPPAINSPSTHS